MTTTGSQVVICLVFTFGLMLAAFKRWTRSDSSKDIMHIRVKWGHDTLHIPLPSQDTPLRQLRDDLADYTHLPADSFKLVHAGAVMKDDSAPISAYKIRENSLIALIGGNATAPSAPQRPSATPAAEQNPSIAIRAELDRVRTSLGPSVHEFVRTISPAAQPASSVTSVPTVTSSAPAPSPASAAHPTASAPPLEKTPTLIQEHTRLSELLLQSLLRLDAIRITDDSETRAERKGAVREVQKILDTLDSAWASASR